MIVCADDYGLTPGNDAAILKLARARRISAISVMTALPVVPGMDTELINAASGALDIGLHLMLTPEAEPASKSPRSLLARNGKFCSFAELARRSFLGKISEPDIRDEISAQMDVFYARFGKFPDYLDGHLHVQQLPVVRDAVAALSFGFNRKSPFYVRNAWTPFIGLIRNNPAPFKSAVIAMPGRRLRHILLENNVPTNRGFAGVYDFRRRQNFKDCWPKFIAAADHHNAIIMTHPGVDEEWRRLEFETLMNKEGIRPNRFRHS